MSLGSRASLHLGLALAGSVVVIVAQLSSWTEVTALTAGHRGARATVTAILGAAFVTITAMALLRHACLMTFAYLDAVRSPPRQQSRDRWPSVSILIPAHDEAGRIERALRAIQALDYPDIEAIVVDDGSSDDTFQRARRFGGDGARARIKVLRKENGGKWSALNLAFRHASGELVLCMDADSHLGVASLKMLAAHFDDPRVCCCAGQVVVRNGEGLLARLQSLEYVMMNALARRAQSYFGTVLVAPGPISMFRRATLEEVARRWGGLTEDRPPPSRGHLGGPWESDTFAEDADLSLNLLLTGQRAVYEARAVSYTTVPASTFALLNQRYRWTRGSFQAAHKAWRRWQEDPDAPRLLPFWLGMLLFETVAWPLLNFGGFVAFGAFIGLFGLRWPLLAWFLALTALDVNAAAFGATVEGADRRLVRLAVLNRVYFSLLLDVSKFYALFDELRGIRMRWS